jgi:hypothetical protein
VERNSGSQSCAEDDDSDDAMKLSDVEDFQDMLVTGVDLNNDTNGGAGQLGFVNDDDLDDDMMPPAMSGE